MKVEFFEKTHMLPHFHIQPQKTGIPILPTQPAAGRAAQAECLGMLLSVAPAEWARKPQHPDRDTDK